MDEIVTIIGFGVYFTVLQSCTNTMNLHDILWVCSESAGVREECLCDEQGSSRWPPKRERSADFG